MKGNHLTLLFVVLIGMLVPSFLFADTGNISRLVFTIDPVSVSPGAISDAITVQTQNGSGEAEDVSETNDVTFQSSSATGEFLNSSGNPVSTTMAKNSASRNFYYRDSTNGTHTITVKITGRESGKSFETSQTITVGAGASNHTNESSSNSSSSSSKSSRNSLEAHSSPSPSADTDISASGFEISAGRDRLASAGAPVDFDAKIIKPKGLNIEKIKLFWSFGDGTKVKGSKAVHTYSFAGDYTVVLNASYLGEEAVSRINVKVIESNLSISHSGDDYVEITNNGTYEENLGGWMIETDKGRFLIAEDTIVQAKGSIKIASTITGFMGASGWRLLNPSMGVVSDGAGMVAGAFKSNNLEMDSLVIESLKKEIFGDTGINTGTSTTTAGNRETTAVVAGVADDKNSYVTESDALKTEKSSDVVFTVEEPKKISWFKKMFGWLFD